MPSKVRIISPKNSSQWDDLIRTAPMKTEHTYGGIVNNERADKVRRSLRTAGRHLGVAVKAFWSECDQPGQCQFGDDCAFHVKYTVFSLDEARKVMAARAGQAGSSRR